MGAYYVTSRFRGIYMGQAGDVVVERVNEDEVKFVYIGELYRGRQIQLVRS